MRTCDHVLDFSPHLKEEAMTPEQRLDRVEYILGRMAKSGREARTEFRYKINALIDAQMKNEAAWRAESQAINEQIRQVNEQIKAQAVAQAELTKSQKLTDKALRAFINSLRKNDNGHTSQ
jgi:hypothetical protein